MSPFDHLGKNMMSRKCIFPRKARHPQGLAVSSFAAGKMRKWRSIEFITRFHPSYRVGWYGPMRKLLAIYIGLIHSVAVNLEIPAHINMRSDCPRQRPLSFSGNRCRRSVYVASTLEQRLAMLVQRRQNVWAVVTGHFTRDQMRLCIRWVHV